MKGLPVFPSKTDMWLELKNEKRPILIYGMGNGADKLISRFSELGIAFADIFASDGFVRGHSFHGVRVKSFSEVRELYSDFVIVLSFATRLPEVIEMLSEMNERYDLYIPDMPVSEESVYFDSKFFNEHIEEIKRACESLDDEESKNVYNSIIRYKLSGRMSDLLEFASTKEEMYSFFSRVNPKRMIDVGAYSGDTLKEAREFFSELSFAACIEPDKKTFKRLLKTAESIEGVEVECINAAAWSFTGQGQFANSSNRNSSVLSSSTHSYQHKVDDVSLIRVDDVAKEGIDYVKYDVEGSEREALLGSELLIDASRPALLVSLYHKSRDIFELINLLKERYPDYKFYLRRLRCLPAWEINLIMLP